VDAASSLFWRGNFIDVICSGCRDNLDHCHGMLIVHADETVECDQPGCLDLDRVRHEFVVVCDENPAGRCDCLLVATTGRQRRRRAA
jgi:hypothetical protein